MDWLPLVAIGIMWSAFLLPGPRRRPSPRSQVHDFERGMELLAYSEVQGTTGRWIVTPRKGMRFIGTAERCRARSRERRRKVLAFLLESIGLTFLIGLVPPLRAIWYVSAGMGVLLAVYVWLLLTLKHRSAVPATSGPRRHRGRAMPPPRPSPDTWLRAAARGHGRPSTAWARWADLIASTWSCERRVRSPGPDRLTGGPRRTRSRSASALRRSERRPGAGASGRPAFGASERQRDPRDPSKRDGPGTRTDRRVTRRARRRDGLGP